METRNENREEKRRKKIISRPVLVRSAKPGQVASASYDHERQTDSFWKAA